MQKKVNLLLRDEFSLLVGVRAAVKLNVRTVRGRAGFNEIRIEDGRFEGWDDCTQAVAPNGVIEAWQVKTRRRHSRRQTSRRHSQAFEMILGSPLDTSPPKSSLT